MQGLLDSNGNPLSERIQSVLARLLPRLRRQFPVLQDEAVLTDVLEEAGRRIAVREERGGPIDRLHGYAWVTIRSVATSRIRRGSIRLIQNTLESVASDAKLATVPAASGTAEDVERAILLREVLAKLSHEERLVCLWKKAGFSTEEIARHQGRSVGAVGMLFTRAKQKLRAALSTQHGTTGAKTVAGAARGSAATRELDEEDSDDGRTKSAGRR